MRPDAPLADALDEALVELGMEELASRSRRQLLDLAELLAVWGRRFNLTAHRSADAILRRLVLDALALERVLPPAARIADLGSGAGFPGLPLAVLRPGSHVLLVEVRERRHHFQRTAVRELGLGNVTPIRGRIETLAPEASEGVVAQALADPARAAKLGVSWCCAGGWIAVPGAESVPEPGPVPGVERKEQRRYQVPIGGPRRTLWLGWRGQSSPAT